MKKSSILDIYSIYLKHPHVVKDTREIQAGSLFVALKGENHDANEFADQALENGASYVIIDNPEKQKDERYLLVDDTLKTLQELALHHRKQLSIPVLGITGSNGKTSTKELIASVMKQEKKTFATPGNYNNHIGVPLSLLSIGPEHEFAIIEMGANHQGEIAFLSSLSDPDYGIITNIGKAHLEGFGGIEGVKKGKSELYKHLASKNGRVFINGDDEVLLDLAVGLDQIKYGTRADNDCVGTLQNVQPNIDGLWQTKNAKGVIKSSLYGKYNFYNILAAICVGSHFGLSAKSIDQGIQSYTSENNRSEIREYRGASIFLDAYNANPSSMELALKQFQLNQKSHKILVLGDMFEIGETEAFEHEKIIKLCQELQFDEVIFAGNRFLKFKANYPYFDFFKDASEVKEHLKNRELKGMELLIKGSRGMALEKIIQ